MTLPISKSIDGAYRPIYSAYINSTPQPYYGGEQQCDCCTDCCVEMTGGTDNGDGTYTFDTTAVEFTVTLPNPNSRVVCDGEIVRVDWELKPGYTSGSNQNHFAWATRDWIIVDSARSGSYLHTSQANWRVWENNTNSGSASFRLVACWIHYDQHVGEIAVGADVSEPTGETQTITFVPTEESTELADCCPYDNDCEECKWTWPKDGDAGPERPFPPYNEWWYQLGDYWIKITHIPDGDNKTVERGGNYDFNVSIQPAKDAYKSLSTLNITMCGTFTGWVDKGGTRTKVGSTDGLYLQSGCGSAVVTDQCAYHIVGPTTADQYFDYYFEAGIPECNDDCVDDAWYISSPTFTIGASTVAMEWEECNDHSDCCGSESESSIASSGSSSGSGTGLCDCYCFVVVAGASSYDGSEPPTFDPGPDWEVWYEGEVVDNFSTPPGQNYHDHVYAISYCGENYDNASEELQSYIDDDWETSDWSAYISVADNDCENVVAPDRDQWIEDNVEPHLTTPAAPNETVTILIDEPVPDGCE